MLTANGSNVTMITLAQVDDYVASTSFCFPPDFICSFFIIIIYFSFALRRFPKRHSCHQAGDSMRVLPCFHRFHVEEIDDWLDRNTTCPLCHLDISEALTG